MLRFGAQGIDSNRGGGPREGASSTTAMTECQANSQCGAEHENVLRLLGFLPFEGRLIVRGSQHDGHMTMTQGTLIEVGAEAPLDDAALRAAEWIADFECHTDELRARTTDLAQLLESVPVGPALAWLLAATDVALLAPDAQLAYVVATERVSAWVHSLQNSALVAYAGETPRITRYNVDGRGEELVDERRSHLARRLLWSESMAHQRLTAARTLFTSLPACASALAAGNISALRAQALAESARTLTSRVDALLEVTGAGAERDALLGARATLLHAFERAALPHATRHDLARTRARCRTVVAAIDPDGLAWRRAMAARDLTAVTVRHEDDGLSTLQATLPSELAIECLRAIDGTADDASLVDPVLPVGVRRAYALHGLLTGALRRCEQPHAATREPSDGIATSHIELPARRVSRINVTIDLPTLLGLRNRPAELDGVGPIPADVVRELLGRSDEASIRWLVTDDAGAVIDTSPRRYRLGTALRELIIARDRVCAEPNCSTPAERCEIDHVTPFDAGGSSTADNLQPRCKRHHQLKTHGMTALALPAGAHVEPQVSVFTVPLDTAAAVDLVNRHHRTRERALEYGEHPAAHEAALQDAQLWLDAARAADRTRTAQHIARYGCLYVTFDRSLGFHTQRQRR